jgi:hypothetical protein
MLPPVCVIVAYSRVNFTVTYTTHLHLFMYFFVSDFKSRCDEYQDYGLPVCDTVRSG